MTEDSRPSTLRASGLNLPVEEPPSRAQARFSREAFAELDQALQLEGNGLVMDAIAHYRAGVQALRAAARIDWSGFTASSDDQMAREKILRNLKMYSEHLEELEHPSTTQPKSSSSTSSTSSKGATELIDLTSTPTINTMSKSIPASKSTKSIEQPQQNEGLFNSFKSMFSGGDKNKDRQRQQHQSDSTKDEDGANVEPSSRGQQGTQTNNRKASLRKPQLPSSATSSSSTPSSQQRKPSVPAALPLSKPSTPQSNSARSGPQQPPNPINSNKSFSVPGVDNKLVETIVQEVLDKGPAVTWNDVVGMEKVKQILMETVILPVMRPDIFTGLAAPIRGLLLFGPPGNGKTFIAKAVASEAKATFFSISASTLTSKYVGDGEKLVRALFAVARYVQPSIIFIDEIDSILSERSSNEHEASRRLKTQFLVEFDGVAASSDDRLLVMGATNRPNDLDEAARRRLVKRIYIPLPDAASRRQLIVNLLKKAPRHAVSAHDVEQVVAHTDGYSNSDLTALCKDAALGPIREQGMRIQNIDASELRPIQLSDFSNALRNVRPSVSKESLRMYEDWNKQYGSN